VTDKARAINRTDSVCGLSLSFHRLELGGHVRW